MQLCASHYSTSDAKFQHEDAGKGAKASKKCVGLPLRGQAEGRSLRKQLEDQGDGEAVVAFGVSCLDGGGGDAGFGGHVG